MTQPQVNIKRLVDNIKKSNAYTPLVEAVANSIDAIEEAGRDDGEIILTLVRSPQDTLGNIAGDELKPFSEVMITDNGIGFNDRNLEAFNTIYSEKKIREGGKGFGRFVYLKYFDSVSVESVYVDKSMYFQRKFNFVKDATIIQNENTVRLDAGKAETTLHLENLKLEHLGKIDKTIETIARKLLEKLLVYFVIDGYKCPKIIVRELGGVSVVLNDMVGSGNGIENIGDKEFVLETSDKTIKKSFKAKIFKIFYGESRSSINLVADRRQVTEEALYTYVPEFKDDFYDISSNEKGKEIKKNYTIKTYILGKYLDENVSLERDGFEFSATRNSDLFYPFSQMEIEKEAAKVASEIFKDEVKTRQQKKEADIRDYVDTKAPWHKSNFPDLDLSKLPYKATEAEIETALEGVRFGKEQQARKEISKILESADEALIVEKVDALIGQITDIQKNELAHYVALRRAILDVFKKSLTWNENKKYEKEKVIHDIIFPTKSNSDSASYDRHNLWLIDEKLSFTEYIASDKPLNEKDERPDLLIFDNKIAVRDGDTPSNPIIVFEFKKPQRDSYAPGENPLIQIADYVRKIRDGNFKNPEGRFINATQDTPAYGFLVCDPTSQIKGFCEALGLTKSPDQKGYFGFHPNYKIYYEVISFDRLVENSELRNKIFFKMLGM
jgi:hypothetical protein